MGVYAAPSPKIPAVVPAAGCDDFQIAKPMPAAAATPRPMRRPELFAMTRLYGKKKTRSTATAPHAPPREGRERERERAADGPRPDLARHVPHVVLHDRDGLTRHRIDRVALRRRRR